MLTICRGLDIKREDITDAPNTFFYHFGTFYCMSKLQQRNTNNDVSCDKDVVEYESYSTYFRSNSSANIIDSHARMQSFLSITRSW